MTGIRKAVAYAGMVIGVVLILKFLNWVPAAFHREAVKRYHSVEEAGADLRMKPLRLPSYFPQYLSWPPDEILGRKRPFPLVLLHFSDRQRQDIALAVRQADSRDPSPVRSRVEPVTIHTRERITVKGRPALLSVATCPGGRACNSVTWQDGAYTFTVTVKDSVREAVAIAESMLPE